MPAKARSEGLSFTTIWQPRPRRGRQVKLEILDEAGNVLRSYGRKPAGYDKLDDAHKAMEPGPWLPLQAGMNTFVWNLRLPGATKVLGNKTAGEAAEGPYVLPGHYQVRLTCRRCSTGTAVRGGQ